MPRTSKPEKFEWEPGMQADLARAAGISRGFLGDILHRRKRASPDTAAKIADAAADKDIPLTREDLLYPADSKSTAFLA